MTQLQTLASRAEALHKTYQQNFSGRTRVTRDLKILDELISGISDLREQATGQAGSESSLLPTLNQRMELYTREREAISDAQAGGPDVLMAHQLSDQAWLAHQRYIRHFAGQPRRTRDLGLLRQLRDELYLGQAALARLAAKHEADWQGGLLTQLTNNLELYTQEVEEIIKARKGVPQEKQAPLLATLANGQFSKWRQFFANRPRHTRRISVLRRVIAELRDVYTQMLAVRDQGESTPAHRDNIAKVADRLQVYESELTQIEQSAGRAGSNAIAAGLADEANAQFKKYRSQFSGKSRADVDLTELGEICDQLQELALAMRDLDQTWQLPVNQKNLEIVVENLKMYEREFQKVRTAKTPV